MKKHLLAAFTTALMAQSASAGTLDQTAIEVAPAPALAASDSFDRRYYGATLGFGDGLYTNGVSTLDEVGVDIAVDGPLLGLRYGRTYQTGGTVWGYDVDIGTGPAGLTPQGSPGPDWACVSGDCTVNINALMSARGLYGFALGEDNLVYGAAGLAAAAVDGGIANSIQEGSGTAFGYTAAIGYERSVSDRLSMFGEIAYYDLGALPFGEGNSPNETFDAVGSFAAIRLGVNFEF